MEFQELIMPNAWLLIGASILMAALMIFSVTIFVELGHGEVPFKLKLKKSGIIALGVVSSILFIVLFALSLNYTKTTQNNNGEKFENNLKVKYDISEIKLFEGTDELGKVTNLRDPRDASIEVKTKDGVRVRFLVTADPKTGEPTLEDPAIEGGASNSPSVSANDLLKNK